MSDFVHLHVHTEYSLLDGACRIKELVARVKEMGQSAVAITDHGNMFGAVDFYDECKAQGVKAIIGCETYVAPRTRFDKVPKIDAQPYHLVLLCENQTGYQNLIKLVSASYIEGFYNRPRVDLELLREHHQGLICLSACMAGEISRKLESGDYEGAKETALTYREIFGEDNYFIEIQNQDFIEQKRIIPLQVRLARETGIKLVATNDCHYISKQDADAQQVLMCISTATTLDDPNKMSFPTKEFYVKSAEEMGQAFSQYQDALDNTVDIANRCNIEFEFGVTKLPYFHIEGVENNEKFLRDMCRKGLYERYESPSDEAIKRMEYELDVITQMGYVEYYLIVWDFIHYAKSKKIPVGCGRGSGAGSLCAYCIGITGIDPLKYNLLFERFLNPERVSMPDFDIDFCIEGRQRVIDYVIRKYGSDHVAQIVTFGTLAAKQAVRDCARAMGHTSLGDVISKAVPRGFPLRYSVENIPAVKDLYHGDANVHAIIDTAIKVEGLPRNASTHAAGVVITKNPVDFYAPLYCRDGQVSTMYTMTALERLGLLKIDFLGLRNLTIINHCQLEVRKQNPKFDIEKIPLDDKSVYDMLSMGKTVGVFQFESAGMTATIVKLRPEKLEDLIAVLSLYRPGPMDSIPQYIRNRHNPSLVTYKHPLLKEILEVTYGCIVYQEQVMQIFRTLAGYSYGRADIVRRAMAKKKAKVLENERKAFVYGEKGQCVGCVANGVDEKLANDIFDEMQSFASYAFNKSHAAAYATIAYQTAYLKCHYYKEYMASLMTTVLMDSAGYITECKNNGVRILPVDINNSRAEFVAERDGIRFALMAVKNLGEAAIQAICCERDENGKYKSLQDFCTRNSGGEVNTRAVEFLIKSGAFDCFENNRHEMLNSYEQIMQNCAEQSRTTITGQLDFFGLQGEESISEQIVERCDEFSRNQLLEFEHDALGMYICGHPLDEYTPFACAYKCTDFAVINSYAQEHNDRRDGDKVDCVGTVTHKKMLKTKKGDQMSFVTMEDMSAQGETIFFPEAYSRYVNLIKESNIVHIQGKLSIRDDEPAKVLVSVAESGEQFIARCMNKNLCVRVNSDDKFTIDKIRGTAMKYKDNNSKTQLSVFFADMRKMTALKDCKAIKLCAECIKDFIISAGDKNVAFMDKKPMDMGGNQNRT